MLVTSEKAYLPVRSVRIKIKKTNQPTNQPHYYQSYMVWASMETSLIGFLKYREVSRHSNQWCNDCLKCAFFTAAKNCAPHVFCVQCLMICVMMSCKKTTLRHGVEASWCSILWICVALESDGCLLTCHAAGE